MTRPPSPVCQFRLAPAGEDIGGLLHWSPEAVSRPAADGSMAEIYIGSVVEVAALSTGDVVVRQEDETSKIYLVSNGRPRELLVGDETQLLELEGSGLSAESDPVVFYQRQQLGDPATNKRPLRRFNVATKEVEEVAVTGGMRAASTSVTCRVASQWDVGAPTKPRG